MALNLKRKRDKSLNEHASKKRASTSKANKPIADDHSDPHEDEAHAGIPEDEDEDEGAEDGIGAPASTGEGQSDDEGGVADEDEWDGIGSSVGAGATHEHRTGTKPKKPPTGEEVRIIREAADLYRSSSFKLQIDALLPNVRPKESRKAPLDRFLLSLHTFLSSLPSIAPQHPLEAARALLHSLPDSSSAKAKRKLDKGKGKAAVEPIAVPYPFPVPTEDANWKVAFAKPSDIVLVGSWANKLSVKAKDGEPWGVDVAVEMPQELFQEKDYMNSRFFHKRAFFLAVIARHVTDAKTGFNVETLYESRDSDPRLTTLVLRHKQDGTPTDFSKLNAQVRIIPYLSAPSPIPLSRLSPHRSNLRVHDAASPDEPPAEHLPTPLYNAALLLSTTPKPHLLAAHALKEDIPSYVDALALLRIWANQRGYGVGKRMCVRGFEGAGAWWGAVLELLVRGEAADERGKAKLKALGRGLSSYQLFKAALDFLARHDFTREPVFVKHQEGHRFPPENYTAHHGATSADSTSTVNLLASVPPSSLEMLRHDAKTTLESLDGGSISSDPFPEVFLREHRDLPARFDIVIRVDLSSARMRRPSVHEVLEHGSPANALLASLASHLRRALGSRVKALSILHSSSEPRPLSQAHPITPSIVCIGLVLDSENAFRLVEHGPAASEEETNAAKEFRDLWGDNKAELRRFKDGSIVESVVWEVKDADERAQIPIFVVRHILERHFAVHPDLVQSWQPGFDGLLKLPQDISSLYLASGRPAGFKAAMAAFDELVKAIKALDEDLPLAVLNVSPVSAYLRYTSVFNPVAMTPSLASALPASARYMPVMDIILEFEKSSRWPDDLRAIQKMKLAFFERLATALMISVKGLTARVVVGERLGASAIADQGGLEIVTPLGWAFSARLWHDREATLLNRIIEQNDVPKLLQKLQNQIQSSPKDREEALEARALYLRRFVHAPRHHRVVAALNHRFAAFSGTVRLVKRWLAAHWLLRSHVSEEAVEIVCASLFVGGGSGRTNAGAPSSRERGFARVVELLKDWQWTAGMFVPLYGEESAEDAASSSVSVSAGSKGVWTLSTEFDRDGHMWTADGPDIVAAHRVRALAKATFDVLQGMEAGSLDVKALFVHPEDDYDFVVRLDPSVLPRYAQNVVADSSVWSKKGKYANLSDEEVALRPGFDPAQLFLEDVKRTYADTLKIFYDPLGGDRFGAVWDPSLREPRPFRVLNHFSSVPLPTENDKPKDRGLVKLNEAAVLSEIVRLGAGLVRV
ncbi:Nrap protein [Auriscalpium vulgare]|uniref:Nrap protein n=1 Tax=Auriscalpium vulgare TaxID=40419 RepID=A0ACB8S503_9AGAM|nr:Nrap protein [Auriscalpium vulgare]